MDTLASKHASKTARKEKLFLALQKGNNKISKSGISLRQYIIYYLTLVLAGGRPSSYFLFFLIAFFYHQCCAFYAKNHGKFLRLKKAHNIALTCTVRGFRCISMSQCNPYHLSELAGWASQFVPSWYIIMFSSWASRPVNLQKAGYHIDWSG